MLVIPELGSGSILKVDTNSPLCAIHIFFCAPSFDGFVLVTRMFYSFALKWCCDVGRDLCGSVSILVVLDVDQ